MDRRFFLTASLSCAALSSPAGAEILNASLQDRVKWRSFGGDTDAWVYDDPFERALPGAVRLPYSEWKIRRTRGQVGQLLDLIAFAEAGKHQYDAIHMSATRLPRARPTQLTLSEIFVWIKATPGQHHAIGRYQFIPSTLRALVRRAGLPHSTRFTPEVQDKLASFLLDDARYPDFLEGRVSRDRFMNNLAKIWAGLPTKNGKSYYHGYAGNRSTISRRFFAAQIDQIFG